MSKEITLRPMDCIIAIGAAALAIKKMYAGDAESAWYLILIAIYAGRAAVSITPARSGENKEAS